MKRPPIAVAVDIGGTKVRAAAIDGDGRMLASSRLPSAARRGGVHVLAVIEAAIEALFDGRIARESVCGLGISSAGVIEPNTGAVVGSADAIPGWQGTILGEHFERRFGWPVVADNDANCALLGEIWRGGHALSASCNAVMITLGTGLGGAMVIEGKLVTGRHHLTGHFGIAKMWDPDSGHLVKVEHLVSGTGLGNIYAQLLGVVGPIAGADVIQKHLAARADPLATRALTRWCEHLALELHNLYWMIDPEIILVGGGMIDARAHWWPQLEIELARMGVTIPVGPAALGNDAGVFGAAKRVFDGLAAA